MEVSDWLVGGWLSPTMVLKETHHDTILEMRIKPPKTPPVSVTSATTARLTSTNNRHHHQCYLLPVAMATYILLIQLLRCLNAPPCCDHKRNLGFREEATRDLVDVYSPRNKDKNMLIHVEEKSALFFPVIH